MVGTWVLHWAHTPSGGGGVSIAESAPMRLDQSLGPWRQVEAARAFAYSKRSSRQLGAQRFGKSMLTYAEVLKARQSMGGDAASLVSVTAGGCC